LIDLIDQIRNSMSTTFHLRHYIILGLKAILSVKTRILLDDEFLIALIACLIIRVNRGL